MQQNETKYYTVRTVPISNWNIVEMYVKSIPLTRIYTTTHFSVWYRHFKKKVAVLSLHYGPNTWLCKNCKLLMNLHTSY